MFPWKIGIANILLYPVLIYMPLRIKISYNHPSLKKALDFLIGPNVWRQMCSRMVMLEKVHQWALYAMYFVVPHCSALIISIYRKSIATIFWSLVLKNADSSTFCTYFPYYLPEFRKTPAVYYVNLSLHNRN